MGRYENVKLALSSSLQVNKVVLHACSPCCSPDFGLSIDFSSENPVTRVGTLDYMAPEVGGEGQGTHIACKC